MRRLIDFLAPVGVLLAAGSWVSQQTGYEPPGGLGLYLAAGAALVVAHLLLRFEDIGRAVGGRQFRFGANMLVLILAVAGILVFGNYLVNKNTKRWDLTKGRRLSLSDQSRKIVSSLEEDVTILYFQRNAELAAGQANMKKFETASPRIKVEYVDPVVDPIRGKLHDVTAVPTLIVSRGDRQEKISNDSEQDITNALIKLTRDDKKSVCFVEGEGERDIDSTDPEGYSGAREALAKSQYETRKLLLMREGHIPEDCTVLVVAGPSKDLLESAVTPLREHVQQGGRLLVMVEPELNESFSALTGLLEQWNVQVGNDLVLDYSLQSQLAGTGPVTPLAAQYPYHEITKDFTLATAFHTARSATPGEDSIEGITAQSLVQTSEASWAETDLSTEGLKKPKPDPGKDRNGPVSLGAVAIIKTAPPAPSLDASSAAADTKQQGNEQEDKDKDEDEDTPPEGRVVVFGDADFASNNFLDFPGNKDLFLNSVAWLAEDSELISIRPPEPEDQRLFLTASQQRLGVLFSLIVLPGLFVVAGVMNWWRRR